MKHDRPGRPQKVTDRQILDLLPATAGTISFALDLDRSTMGQRLWRLVDDGLVVAWQIGTTATVFIEEGDTPLVTDCLGARKVRKRPPRWGS